jgi:hypothetical protein
MKTINLSVTGFTAFLFAAVVLGVYIGIKKAELKKPEVN